MEPFRKTGYGSRHPLPTPQAGKQFKAGRRMPHCMMLRARSAISLLIASTDDWSTRALESILGAEGLGVCHARSLNSAVDMVLSGAIDAVLTDETLPDSSFLELCRLLRTTSGIDSGLPVILILHGPVDRDTRLAAHEAGIWQVFGEPLDTTLLVRQLEVFTAGNQRRHLRPAGLPAV